MGLVGNGWVNCFRTHNELTMGLLGKYPLAPSDLCLSLRAAFAFAFMFVGCFCVHVCGPCLCLWSCFQATFVFSFLGHVCVLVSGLRLCSCSHFRATFMFPRSALIQMTQHPATDTPTSKCKCEDNGQGQDSKPQVSTTLDFTCEFQELRSWLSCQMHRNQPCRVDPTTSVHEELSIYQLTLWARMIVCLNGPVCHGAANCCTRPQVKHHMCSHPTVLHLTKFAKGIKWSPLRWLSGPLYPSALNVFEDSLRSNQSHWSLLIG